MARAVLALSENLVEEATCPLCLELFREPVITECGHSYCGPCLAELMGVPPRPIDCPQCRAAVAPASLRPNRSLRACWAPSLARLCVLSGTDWGPSRHRLGYPRGTGWGTLGMDLGTPHAQAGVPSGHRLGYPWGMGSGPFQGQGPL
uniref:RING-type domain-containing protein n=1 Tax=Strigops habroptila TaxID=2489341 RepID=A0A672TXU2_STRHB